MLIQDQNQNIYAKEQVFSFPFGIPAFGDLVKWALSASSQIPFYTLRSVQENDISFVLLDPKSLFPDYDPALDKSDYSILHLDSSEDPRARLFCITNIPPDGSLENTTVNLRAPLLFNTEKCCAAQCLGMNDHWEIRHSLMAIMQEDLSLC